MVSYREEHESPGLQDFEANFLRLVDKLTDGTVIEINETGTRLILKPGIILGRLSFIFIFVI